MGWFTSDTGVRLTCHKCRTRFKIASHKTLRDGAKTACRRCGTRFGVRVISASLPRPQESLDPTSHSIRIQSDAPSASSSSESRTHRLFFRGSGGTLFGIHLVNLFVTLLTLGLYSFWAKVKVRQWLWGHTEVAGDRLAYHGTGMELLKGFIRAVLIFGIPYLVIATGPELARSDLWIQFAGRILAAILVVIFVPIAIVAARRYRLSRTSWRGIRFSFRGKSFDFAKIFLSGTFLNVVTLGAYYPFFDTKRHAFLTSHTYMGNQRFRFYGEGMDLSKSFLIAYLLTVPTMGLCWFWYKARVQRYFWEHTYLGQNRFHFPVTGWQYFKLKVGNLALLILTLGFAWPWVLVRNIRFVLRNLTLKGPTDLEVILQESQSASPTGEGLESLLDTGFEFG